MDDRGPAPLRAGHAGGDAAGHACPLGSHDRRHRSARAGGPTAGLDDPGHAPGLVARRPRRSRLATAAARLAPHQTVWSRLQSWQRQAVLDRALRLLVACRRLAAGRKRWPTAAIIDTQSVKTGPQRGPRGYDANKKIKGRKRVLLIDTQGDPLGVQVVSGEVQDRDALRALAPDLDVHASLLLAWLDRGFAGNDQRAFLQRYGVTPEIVGTPGPQGLPGRAPTLEDRADLRLPATLSSAPGRRRDEQRDLAPHDRPGFGVHGRHAPRAHAPAVTISGRLAQASVDPLPPARKSEGQHNTADTQRVRGGYTVATTPAAQRILRRGSYR